MIKNKITCFKITGLDFNYLKKQAKKQKVSVSELLRRLIEKSKKKK